MKFKALTINDINNILNLTQILNPNTAKTILHSRQMQMFGFDNYKCFGLYEKGKLLGLSSVWITVKLYSGKQLEIDNVIIDSSIQSKGLGRIFLNFIEDWAKENGCQTIELNTYIQNSRSHKFYFNLGYKILGFHFQKEISS